MPDFGLDEDDVRWTLNRVHYFQSWWMVFVGTLLAAAPERRFGNSYQFLLRIPTGRYVIAGLFVATGIVMVYALAREQKALMSKALAVGGLGNFIFGVFLGLGAVFGPTGVVGAPYTFYAAGHMLIQGELLATRGETWLHSFIRRCIGTRQ